MNDVSHELSFNNLALDNFMVGLAEADGDMEKALDNGITLFHRFVTSFIDFPKPIIGAVNGPAFGIMVSFSILFDILNK